MSKITADTTLKELSGIVASALDEAGIVAVLVGGAASSFYSDNVYQTYDLDFVSQVSDDVILDALAPLGFAKEGKNFVHPATRFTLEFPARELYFGGVRAPFESATTLSTSMGEIRIITPTQLVMDRIAAFVWWKDQPSLQQAIDVARMNQIEWEDLYAWAQEEGISAEVIDNIKGFDEGV